MRVIFEGRNLTQLVPYIAVLIWNLPFASSLQFLLFSAFIVFDPSLDCRDFDCRVSAGLCCDLRFDCALIPPRIDDLRGPLPAFSPIIK